MAEEDKVHTGEFLPAIDWKKYAIKTQDGRELTPLEIADEAESADKAIGNFQQHFFMLASKCQNADEFDKLANAIAYAKHWGRPPAHLPLAEKMEWRRAPETFKVYKSTFYKAWKDFDVKPGGQIPYEVKTPQGEMQVKYMEITGINRLKEAVKAARAKKRAGVEVDRIKVELNAHMGTLKQQFEKLPEEQRIDMVKKLEAMVKKYAKLIPSEDVQH